MPEIERFTQVFWSDKLLGDEVYEMVYLTPKSNADFVGPYVVLDPNSRVLLDPHDGDYFVHRSELLYQKVKE